MYRKEQIPRPGKTKTGFQTLGIIALPRPALTFPAKHSLGKKCRALVYSQKSLTQCPE